jgi:hypothetical protein
MTATPTTVQLASQRPAAQRALPAAGAIYVLAWLGGLLITPSAPDTADAAAVHAYFTAHAGGFVQQALLVHGIAGLALGGLSIGFADAVGRGRWITGTGLAAAAVSLVQVALGVIAAHDPANTGSATTTAWLQAVNDADIVKLVLLAAFATATTQAADRTRRLPRWLRVLGYILVPLLVTGGLAFLVPNAALTAMLTASLPALLIWAAAMAWRLHR